MLTMDGLPHVGWISLHLFLRRYRLRGLGPEIDEVEDILIVGYHFCLVLTVLLPLEHRLGIQLQFSNGSDEGTVRLALHCLEGTKVLLKSFM